jgi:two-component system alkaline phosphatase synthesis response regulator PhoP
MASDATRRSILVVDGDQKVIDMLRRNLENSALDVQQATTGLECLRRVSAGATALVIIDTDLADFNVWGILSLLRMTDATAGIPVIMMGEEPPDRTRRLQLQPDDYIQKPFDMRDLLTRVARCAGPVPVSHRAHRAVTCPTGDGR